MSNTQSLANQLGWTITTKDYLTQLNAETRYVSNQYGSMVEMLSQGNYLNELLQQIQQMHHEFENSTNDLIKHIEQDHLAYIETQSKGIRETLSSL